MIFTGTIAIGGLAAWLWSERHEHDEDDYPHDKPPRPQTGIGQPYPTQGSQPYPGPQRPPDPGQQGQYPPGPAPPQGGPPPPGPPPVGGEAAGYYDQSQSYRQQPTESRDVQQQGYQDDSSWYGRVTGMMKRSPSPQDFLNSAGKQVSAGVSAVGGALGSIVEDHESVESDHAYGNEGDVRGSGGSRGDSRRQRSPRKGERRTVSGEKEGFSDHERWSEEAEDQQQVTLSSVEQESEKRAVDGRERGQAKKRKAVAVIVSADTQIDLEQEDDDVGYMTEHAVSHRFVSGCATY